MATTTETSGYMPEQTQQGYGQPQQGYYNYGMPQQGYGQSAGYVQQDSNVNVVVAQPGNSVVQIPVILPPDYLILSIVSCFFCWPMAICALVFSNNSKNSAQNGNYDRALTEGRTARNIGIAAIIFGIVIVVIIVTLNALVFSVVHTYCYGHICSGK